MGKWTYPLHAVIFDMDGTMVDTESLYHDAWQMTARALGYTIGEELLRDTLGKRTEDCYAVIHAALGPAFPIARFAESWWTVWEKKAALDGIARKPGLDQMLNLLEAHQVPMAVATSSARAEASYTLERAELADRFSIVITGDQVKQGKPAPDIFFVGSRSARCRTNELSGP